MKRYIIVDEENDIFGRERQTWYDPMSYQVVVAHSKESADTIWYDNKEEAQTQADILGECRVDELNIPEDWWDRRAKNG